MPRDFPWKRFPHHEPGNYVDPQVALPKSWRDEYHYAADGTLSGWTRHRGQAVGDFDPAGRRIVTPAGDMKPAVTRAVRYVVKPGGPGQAPHIEEELIQE